MRFFSKALACTASIFLAAGLIVSCSKPTGPGEGEDGPDASGGRLALASATPADIGKLVSSDGYIYASSDAARAAGAKVCGVVAYVGNDTGEASFRHGLVLAMKNNGDEAWKSTRGIADNPNQYDLIASALEAKESGCTLTHLGDRNSALSAHQWGAFFSAYWNNVEENEYITKTAPENTSGWFLPSIFQWNKIINGLNGNDAKLTTGMSADLTRIAANKKLTAAGADELHDGAYWSSSEHSYERAWAYWANDGKVTNQEKTWFLYVRSVLAF